MENNTIIAKQLQEISAKYGKLFEKLESVSSGLMDQTDVVERLNNIVENYTDFNVDEINLKVESIAEQINKAYDENPEAIIKDKELLNVAHGISKEVIELMVENENIPQDVFISMTIGEALLKLVTDHINQK